MNYSHLIPMMLLNTVGDVATLSIPRSFLSVTGQLHVLAA
jgi:hypothetical protein